jgi:16S rRNA (cytosine967-C5)-methyltransferase
LVQRWIEELGVEETLKICVANNRIPALTLRTNTLKIRRDDLIGKLGEKGVISVPTPFSDDGILLKNGPPISELPFLNEGLFAIQDEASQLISIILDPRPGEKVLDACAAPGGKTTHIAQRMENLGGICAFDLHQNKLKQIGEGCERLGIKIVRTRVGNAVKTLPEPGRMKFDRVLADVPCSGFGTLRRNPDLKWRKEIEDIKRLGELQFSILKNLSAHLKEGGLLVYSTCTVFHEENEDVVERFLSEHRAFKLDSLVEVLPEKCHILIRKGYFKTFPPVDELDGFFAARLRKTS